MHSPNAKKLTVNVLFYLNHIRDYFCKNIFVYDNKCQYNKTSNFTRWWNFRNAGWKPKTKVALFPRKKYRLMSFEKGLHEPDPDRKTEHCATVIQIRGSPPDLAKIHSLAQPFIPSGSITWVPSVVGELKLDSTVFRVRLITWSDICRLAHQTQGHESEIGHRRPWSYADCSTMEFGVWDNTRHAEKFDS